MLVHLPQYDKELEDDELNMSINIFDLAGNDLIQRCPVEIVKSPNQDCSVGRNERFIALRQHDGADLAELGQVILLR